GIEIADLCRPGHLQRRAGRRGRRLRRRGDRRSRILSAGTGRTGPGHRPHGGTFLRPRAGGRRTRTMTGPGGGPSPPGTAHRLAVRLERRTGKVRIGGEVLPHDDGSVDVAVFVRVRKGQDGHTTGPSTPPRGQHVVCPTTDDTVR